MKNCLQIIRQFFCPEPEVFVLEKFLMHIPDCMIIVDRRGIVKSVNKACTDLLRYEREEIIGQSASLFFVKQETAGSTKSEVAPPENEIYLGKILDELVLRGYVNNLEVAFVSKDGEKIPMNFSGTVLRNRQNKIIGVLGLARDMRSLKKIENEQKKIQVQLFQSAKLASVGELAAGLAHEIGNLLQIILGNIGLLKLESRSLPELMAVEKAALEAKSIIDSLLQFSRYEKLTCIPMNINEVVEFTLKMFGQQLEQDKIEVIKELADNLPLINISASHIQQVFLNIISNSRKAMPEGGILKIKTFFCENPTDTKYSIKSGTGPIVGVSFSDNGVGISTEIIDRIFEPFFTTRKHGTGLGLAVSYGIVKQHGGDIIVFSEGPGKGAEFLVYFPVNFNSQLE